MLCLQGSLPKDRGHAKQDLQVEKIVLNFGARLVMGTATFSVFFDFVLYKEICPSHPDSGYKYTVLGDKSSTIWVCSYS